MAEFLAGTAVVPVVPGATGFSAALQRQIAPATAKLESGFKGVVQRLTGSVTGLGTSIGTSLGLGLGVAAIAAGKMALDFENAFTKIATLSDASAADIGRWKDEVLSLSGETARAPQELADALFFLSSAGLNTGQVMSALTVSAKAAAVGLGSTVDVANITASALNAYAASGLTAVQVTDTLVAAVRAGRAEPEEFANSLGKLLPIAVQAGVSFQDLTASLASLSNVGLDVSESATAVRGALQAIAAPGAAASSALAQLGLSAQDLLDAISQHGLFGAFQLLDKAARDSTNTQADYIGVLRKVIPNVRALTGVLGLTGQAADKVTSVFNQTANATGSLSEAFKTWLKGPGASFAKLFNDLKVAAIRFGEAILPLAKVLAQTLAPALKVAGQNAALLLTAFLGYKAITFLPTLLLDVAVGLDTIGAAVVADKVLAVGVAISKIGPAAISGAAGTAALAYAIGTIPTKPIQDATTKIEGYLKILQPAGDANSALAKTNIAVAVSLGANRAAFIAAISSGDSYAEALKKINAEGPALQVVASGLADVATQSRSVEVSARNVAPAFQLMGTTVKAFQSDAAKAFAANEKDGKAWAAFTQKTLASARQAFEQWQSATATSLDFVGAKFSEIANDFHGSADKITKALRDAFTSEKHFAADLQTITDDGSKGAKLLVQRLIDLGPAGAKAADEIAKANDKTRAGWETLARKGQEFATTTAQSLQTEIVGALTDIRDFLARLAKAWKLPPLHVDTSQATSALDSLNTKLHNLVTTDWTASIRLAVHGGDPLGVNWGATGFHGTVSRPTLFGAGEKGPERVDITPGGGAPGGAGQIRGQLAITDWHRGLVSLQAELDHADLVNA